MNHPKNILVVEDAAEIRSLLSIFLGAEGFNIIEVTTGKDAVHQTIALRPDLVLLDLGLPDMDGQDVIATVRQFANLPIVVLSARIDDREVVRALDAGADDYVTKPFRADVLLARINASLRRLESHSELKPLLTNGPIEIDVGRHEIRLAGIPVSFTPKEFALLQYFVSSKGRLLTHRQILRDVWGPAHVKDLQYLRVYIGQARLKLETLQGLGKCIVAESGVGYRMELLPDTVAASVAA